MKHAKINSHFYDECKKVREAVGGIKNIELINRCSTRIRIKVIDITKLNLNKLEGSKIFVKTLLKDDFVQLIVNENIDEVFLNLLKSLKISYEEIPNDFEVRVNKEGNFFKVVTDGISVIVKPLIPLLITMAIVATLSNVFNGIDFGSGTLSETGQFAKAVGEMFDILQQALNLAFSIMIPWSIFKLMKGSQAIGISIGIVLCFHGLISTNDIMSGEYGDIFKWFGDASFLESGYPWKISYVGQILPIVAMSFIAVYIERFANKFDIPVFKEMVAIPMITISTFFIGILLVGPLGLLLTYGMNEGVVWATTDNVAKYIFNPILGLALPWLVITGLIQVLVVINLQQFTTFGGTTMMPMFTQLNIAVATSILAVTIINRHNKELKRTAIPSYSLAYVSGSTEPALFGVGLKFVYPVIAASIGATVGIIITTFAGVICTNGNASLLVFLSITTKPEILDKFNIHTIAGGPYLWMAIAIVATFITTFFATIGLSKIKVFKEMNAKVLERDFSVN
ncbi:sucrose PTS system IIBC component [Mesoplasma florum W37]|uniref:PTS system trehalose-specific IIB component, PTS system trehalose-specific IIC component n=1 Tax=Mesoplasma florum TaxID=2151 RepID=A0AAD0HS91_MESFO|nr:PTS transporter subunit EIIB [Mesoplasma florum]AGY41623.1 sucrose PTS system IIBC component [Mesoplasma florum W37]AVN59831.1 hypothetical protein CG008_02965 [Mesoplasma florum]AVN65961.1 PTS system trehalose-specific IIB component, PTS system trehalose-specific IIC component [Mesoplasma florum]